MYNGVFKNGVLEVGYVVHTAQSLFRYRDINQPANPSVSSARPFDNGPLRLPRYLLLRKPSRELRQLQFKLLTNKLTLRNRRGWTSMINYTWSHSIDNASDGQDYVANATQPTTVTAPTSNAATQTLITGIASSPRPATVFQTLRGRIRVLAPGGS